MALFLRLPEDLSVEIFCEWSELNDICRLDEASAFSHAKIELERIFTLSTFVHHIDWTHPTHHSVFAWACKKHISISECEISSKNAHLVPEIIWKNMLSIVIAEDFHFTTEGTYFVFLNALNNAPVLDSVVLVHSDLAWDSIFQRLDDKFYQKLKAFAIDKYEDGTFTAIQKVVIHCKQLEEFSLVVSDDNPEVDWNTQVLIQALVVSNPNLISLCLSGFNFSDENLMFMISQCPALKYLNLKQLGVITLKCIIYLIQNGPSLVTIDIANDTDEGNEYLLCTETNKLELSFSINHHVEDMLTLMTLDTPFVKNLTAVWIDNLFVYPPSVIDPFILNNKATLYNVKSDYNDTTDPPLLGGLIQWLTHCTAMEKFQIVSYSDFSNEDLSTAFKTPNNITHLSIDYHDTLNSVGMVNVIHYCDKIVELRCVANLEMMPDSIHDVLIREHIAAHCNGRIHFENLAIDENGKFGVL